MGFKSILLPDVSVTVGVASSIKKVVLEVGQLQETVVVTGSTHLEQSAAVTVSTTLTTAQITKAPLSTRNTLDFVGTVPGVNTTADVLLYSTIMGLPTSAIKHHGGRRQRPGQHLKVDRRLLCANQPSPRRRRVD